MLIVDVGDIESVTLDDIQAKMAEVSKKLTDLRCKVPNFVVHLLNSCSY